MVDRAPVFALALAACSLQPYDGARATATDSTTGAASTGSSTGFTTDSPASGADTVLDVPDAGVDGCDVWTESCPEGQKCMPYSGDGDNAWESLRCVPIVPDPDQLGEPCAVIGTAVSGEDTCDRHLMCWDVGPAGTGTCVAMCTGSADAPDCADPFAGCVIANGGVLILCFPDCDPIAQDCPYSGDLCVPHPDDHARFLCVLGGHTEGLFSPCAYANACDPGQACVDAGLAFECDPAAPGCCLPFCDVDEPDTCPGAGQVCVPWYDDPADAAPHNADVGLCSLPSP